MRIEWSPLALEQVAEAADYIAAGDPMAATRWATSVFDAVQRLRAFPLSGRIVPEVGRSDVRELIHGNYRIVYRSGSTILVLAVRHGARTMDVG